MLGIGTYRLKQSGPGTVYNSVLYGIKLWFQNDTSHPFHIDTAPSYGSEVEIGQAIHDSGISRQNIYVTTKISLPNLKCGTYHEVHSSIMSSLQNLKLDYIDEVCIHQPYSMELSLINWSHLLHFQQCCPGVIHHIGVSNYAIPHLQQIIDANLDIPEFNQIELTPYLKRTALVQMCIQYDIKIVTHSPLAKGERLGITYNKQRVPHIHIKALADRLNVSYAQIMLYWGLYKGYRLIPRTCSQLHMKENIDTFYSINPLTMQDVDILDKIEDEDRYVTHPQYLEYE